MFTRLIVVLYIKYYIQFVPTPKRGEVFQLSKPNIGFCKYHGDRCSTLKCPTCWASLCKECKFKWKLARLIRRDQDPEFYRKWDPAMRPDGNKLITRKEKREGCPHCFVRDYAGRSLASHHYGTVTKSSLFGSSVEDLYKKATLLIKNWEQRMLAEGIEIEVLCKKCGKAFHSSKESMCSECTRKMREQRAQRLEAYKKGVEYSFRDKSRLDLELVDEWVGHETS